jgi:hypothetical protein
MSLRDRLALLGPMLSLLAATQLCVVYIIDYQLELRFPTDFGHPSWAAMTFLIQTSQPCLVVGICLVAFGLLLPRSQDPSPKTMAWAIPASLAASSLFELLAYQYVEPAIESWGLRALSASELILRGAVNGFVLSAIPVGIVLTATRILGRDSRTRRWLMSLVCVLGAFATLLLSLIYRVDRHHRLIPMGFALTVALFAGGSLAGLVLQLKGPSRASVSPRFSR